MIRAGAILVLVSAAYLFVGCSSESDEELILPGRSRPVLEHDWAHPRDYRFDPSSFQPPDPDEARVETPSGLTAYVIPDPSDSLVRISAAIPIGRLYERGGEAGASELLTRLLTRDSRGSPPLSLRLESLGATLDVEPALDGLTLSIGVLPEDFKHGLGLMVGLLRTPSLDPEFIRHFRTGPGFVSPTSGVTGDGFRPKVELERMLGGYPLSPPDAALPVRAAAVRALVSRSLVPNLFVLGIGGKVPREEAVALLTELTSDWATASKSPGVTLPPSMEGSGTVKTIDVDTLEGWIAIGRGIEPVRDEERAALAVLGEILNTRLNIAVREIRGLANRAAFYLPRTSSGAGLLHIRTGGRPEAVAPLVKFCREEMAKLYEAQDAPSKEEMALAKGVLVLGKWQKTLDGARRAAATYALEALRRGDPHHLLAWPSEVEAVTVEQVNEMARKYLDPARMNTVIIGPIELIREARHPRWPVDLDSVLAKTP